MREVVFYEKPGIKVIDFDSVVQNTKSSKSIILMPGFSDILLYSRRFKTANIDKRSARMRSDSVKNMSAYADQNHAQVSRLLDLNIETYSVRICEANFILHKIKMVKTKKSLIFLKSENILINIKDKNGFHVFKGGLYEDTSNNGTRLAFI